MWGDLVDVSNIDGDALRRRRREMGLSQKRLAELMFRGTQLRGNGSTDRIALSGGGMAWLTEAACLRAVQELEGRKRQLKEGQYVYALLATLNLQPAEVGVADPPRIGHLEQKTVEAVEALPEDVRGTMFNRHGEALVYTLDDRVYHSDNDWQGSPVHNGEVHDLILDASEKQFVRAMWLAGEGRRRRAA